jgi:hypothetical protein
MHEEQASDSSVKLLQIDLGIKLPDDYCRFLLKYNGCRVENAVFNAKGYGESVLHHMYGIYSDDNMFDLRKKSFLFKNVIPDEFITIGSDALGNQIILDIDGVYRDKVFFWWHEEGNDVRRDQYKNIFEIADNFNSFIANMKETPDERHGDFSDLFTDENLYEIKKLIESGWDVNSMLSLSSGKMRPIHLMVLRNNIDIATLLVNNGADLEGTVSRAIQSSDKTMLALLLKSGADANEIDSMNRTALKQAIIKGDYEATKLLIDSGADIKIRDKFDRDPIAIAENVKSRGQKRDIGKILELLQSI